MHFISHAISSGKSLCTIDKAYMANLLSAFLSRAQEVLINSPNRDMYAKNYQLRRNKHSVICLQAIIFENDTFSEMGEQSLSVYKNLTMITIKNVAYVNKQNPIHRKIFRELNRLRLLAIENIFTEFEPSFVFPPNLTNLSLSKNDFIKDVDLASASSLTDFQAFGCSLRAFPRFNKSAPIATVDVRWNPLDNWTAEDLAPLCLLKSIHVEWSKRSKLPRPNRFCQCVRLKNWIKKFNITVQRPLNCTPPTDGKFDERIFSYVSNERVKT